MIARAVLNSPEVILADEPTGNLDEATSGEIVRLFQEIAHEQQKCIILVTHEQEVADRAQKIYYIRDGMLRGGATE